MKTRQFTCSSTDNADNVDIAWHNPRIQDEHSMSITKHHILTSHNKVSNITIFLFTVINVIIIIM